MSLSRSLPLLALSLVVLLIIPSVTLADDQVAAEVRAAFTGVPDITVAPISKTHVGVNGYMLSKAAALAAAGAMKQGMAEGLKPNAKDEPGFHIGATLYEHYLGKLGVISGSLTEYVAAPPYVAQREKERKRELDAGLSVEPSTSEEETPEDGGTTEPPKEMDTIEVPELPELPGSLNDGLEAAGLPRTAGEDVPTTQISGLPEIQMPTTADLDDALKAAGLPATSGGVGQKTERGLFGTSESNIFRAYGDKRVNDALTQTTPVNTSCNCVKEAIIGGKRPLATNDSYKQKLDTVMQKVRAKYPELDLKATIFSGTQVDPNRDPAKASGPGSGRHAYGNGGDVYITDGNGDEITDRAVLRDVAQAVGEVNPRSGVGNQKDGTISHIDFEPNPHGGYHGTWSYGGDKIYQTAWEAGAKAHKAGTVSATPVATGNSASGGFLSTLFGDNNSGASTVTTPPVTAAVTVTNQSIGTAVKNFIQPSTNTSNATPSGQSIGQTLGALVGNTVGGQTGASLGAGVGSFLGSILQNLFSSSSDDDEDIDDSPTDTYETIRVPVTITINTSTGSVQATRADILMALESNKDYYLESIGELAAVVAIMNETPMIFGENDAVVYSNGLYFPSTRDGKTVDTGLNYEYTYSIRYVDTDGNYTGTNNSASQTDDYIKSLLNKAFSGSLPFGLTQVESISYRLIDPKANVPADEYYYYEVTLKDGDVRVVVLPQYTSATVRQSTFDSIGYRDDVLALIELATERD